MAQEWAIATKRNNSQMKQYAGLLVNLALAHWFAGRNYNVAHKLIIDADMLQGSDNRKVKVNLALSFAFIGQQEKAARSMNLVQQPAKIGYCKQPSYERYS